MRWKKGHIITTILGFFIPIIMSFTYMLLINANIFETTLKNENNITFVEFEINKNDEDIIKEFKEEELNNLINSMNIEYILDNNGKQTKKIKVTFLYEKDIELKKVENYYYTNETKEHNLIVENKDLYRFNNRLFKVDGEEFKETSVTKEVRDSLKKDSINLGFGFVIVIAGMIIAAYIILKKMDVMKKYRRYTILLSLFLITIITFIISMITQYLFLGVASIFVGWLVNTISWIVYRKSNNLPLYEEIVVKTVTANE